jgi:hypothetical protein
MKALNIKYKRLAVTLAFGLMLSVGAAIPVTAGTASAADPGPTQCANPKDGTGTCGNQCGDGDNAYTPAIDLGCKGKGNPIMDMIFGIIHFLSDGVGIVVIGSIIVGAIQYTGSRGDPQSTAMAVNRLRSSLLAFVLFLFAYAIINYIIPGFAL